jgi:predicted HTH domain antitoxin
MSTATIEYPAELTTALGKRPGDTVREIQLMAALRMYESGRISSGLAARVAGVSRVEFLTLCGQYGVTVFQQTAEEIESDTKAAVHARRG